jgi:hypothetical protein
MDRSTVFPVSRPLLVKTWVCPDRCLCGFPVTQTYSIDQVTHIITSADWSKIQATAAFVIMACVAGMVSVAVSLVILWRFRSDSASTTRYTLWFVSNLSVFILSCVSIWPFVLYNNAAGGVYGNGFRFTVVGCVLFFVLTVGAYWARTQHVHHVRMTGERRHHHHGHTTGRKHRRRGGHSSSERKRRGDDLDDDGFGSGDSQALRYAYEHPIYEVSSDVERQQD